MASLTTTTCCGIRELSGLEGYSLREVLEGCARDWFLNNRDGIHIFFSTTGNYRTGHNLEAYIKKHALGAVLRTKAARNPNSGNLLTMWVWTVNIKNWAAHARKEKLTEF